MVYLGLPSWVVTTTLCGGAVSRCSSTSTQSLAMTDWFPWHLNLSIFEVRGFGS